MLTYDYTNTHVSTNLAWSDPDQEKYLLCVVRHAFLCLLHTFAYSSHTLFDRFQWSMGVKRVKGETECPFGIIFYYIFYTSHELCCEFIYITIKL